MSILDRVIAAVSPSWALDRERARAAMSMLHTVRRSYDAATSSRRTAGWNRVGTGPVTEAGPALSMLRNASHELIRNNPHARRAQAQVARHAVGSGIRPRYQDPRARDIWAAWSLECDPQGRSTWPSKQKLIMRTVFASGAALVLWRPRPSSAGLRVPLQCEVLEPDYIDHSRTGPATLSGNIIIQGIEFDQAGRRVAYYLFDQHPGEYLGPINNTSYQSRRVDARWVDHVFLTLRPGQVHGIPWLAPVALKLRDIADWTDAQIVKAKIEACLAVFIKKVDGTDPGITGATETDDDGRHIERVSPGIVARLQPGEDIATVTPSSSDGSENFYVQQLQAVGIGTDMPHHMLTGDLSQTNYSSMRAGNIDFGQSLDEWQEDMLIPQSSVPAHRRVMGQAAAMGLVAEQPLPAFIKPRRFLVSPKDDMAAIKEAIMLGLETPQDNIISRGADPEETIAELRQWLDMIAGLGSPILGSKPAAAP